ncbi:hypothetical protein LJ740_20390, partial [Planctobacterium marinum]|nr:hypothetical protein [Planctobacterium marinum]
MSRYLNEEGVETLLIKYGENDSITIENWASNPVELIRFLGGPQWDHASINENTPLQLSEEADVFVDGNGGEAISALGGDDLIQAMGGNDTLIGGAGNDRLEGGAGRDTYLFSIGDGQDVISDERGTDTIVFGEAIT